MARRARTELLTAAAVVLAGYANLTPCVLVALRLAGAL